MQLYLKELLFFMLSFSITGIYCHVKKQMSASRLKCMFPQVMLLTSSNRTFSTGTPRSRISLLQLSRWALRVTYLCSCLQKYHILKLKEKITWWAKEGEKI